MPKAADELFDDFFFNYAANRKLQLKRTTWPFIGPDRIRERCGRKSHSRGKALPREHEAGAWDSHLNCSEEDKVDKLREREVRGLVETCRKFPGVKPLIITFNQKDKISYDGMIIEAIPAVEFFTA